VDSALFGIEGARVAPLPPNGTEWWVGAGAPRAINRAARLGDCWYGNADLTLETAARQLEVYREACVRHRREPVRVAIRKDVLVTEEAAEAESVGDALIEAGYRGFSRGAVAYGDPAAVAEQLAPFVELGFTDIITRTMEPLPAELGADAVLRSVELTGEVRSLLG
jgi:alkanesulfonate monooxygenase SsuD/methylene tetrahydromethanopterin reductase-like flavin-dependent oxidoreductase (luciferase family)